MTISERYLKRLEEIANCAAGISGTYESPAPGSGEEFLRAESKRKRKSLSPKIRIKRFNNG